MSENKNAERKLDRLMDSFLDDILSRSDEEILADVAPDDIDRARQIFEQSQLSLSKGLLLKAKNELQSWRTKKMNNASVIDKATIRKLFGLLLSGDPTFQKRVTMAARNGEALSDSDIEGLVSDWDDLNHLNGKDIDD